MSNPYFTASGTPATGALGASSPMRSEFTAVQTAFDKLPALTGNTAIVVNAGGTALTNTVGTLALAGNFATTGAFATTLVAGAATTLTLPVVSGTLATLAGTETLTNKSISGSTNTLTGIGNSSLTNSSLTIGSTSVSLGATVSTFAGLTLTAPVLGAATATSIQFGSGAVLNDYEENPWTPVLQGSAGGAMTHVAQEGYYTRIGRQVTVTFNVQVSSLGTASGALQVAGLPFPVGTETAAGSRGSGALTSATGLTHATGYTAWSCRASSGGTSVIVIRENGSGVADSQQQITNTAAATTLVGMMTYFV